MDAGGGFQNYPEDYEVISQLHQRGELTLRIAYNLFTQKPQKEKEDFARWWGAWPGVGKAAWSGLADELVEVSIDGQKLQTLGGDIDAIQKARIEQPVQLLPLFDPYLLGYSNRDHLFEKVHAPKVSRIAGWISAVVLINGRVEGTWTHAVNKGTLRIVTLEVRKRATEIAKALGAARAEVRFA